MALRTLTFNLRVDRGNRDSHPWPTRRSGVKQIIRRYDAHVVGVQEGLPGMLADLDEGLDEYGWFGAPRDGNNGEHCAIFVRTADVAVDSHDTFWLSETPTVPGSQSWDAAMPRVVTWGHLSGADWPRPLFVFNTHFDHEGERARRRSAALLLNRVEEIAGADPSVVLGDLNAIPGSAPYEILTDRTHKYPLRDAFTESRAPHRGPVTTFHDFDVDFSHGMRIDYIFVRGSLVVRRHTTLTDRSDDRFPSDHFPVFAEIAFTD